MNEVELVRIREVGDTLIQYIGSEDFKKATDGLSLEVLAVLRSC